MCTLGSGTVTTKKPKTAPASTSSSGTWGGAPSGTTVNTGTFGQQPAPATPPAPYTGGNGVTPPPGAQVAPGTNLGWLIPTDTSAKGTVLDSQAKPGGPLDKAPPSIYDPVVQLAGERERMRQTRKQGLKSTFTTPRGFVSAPPKAGLLTSASGRTTLY